LETGALPVELLTYIKSLSRLFMFCMSSAKGTEFLEGHSFRMSSSILRCCVISIFAFFTG